MRFSERYGYKPVRDVFQVESMDDALRNSLWSLLTLDVWDRVPTADEWSRLPTGYRSLSGNKEVELLCQKLWFTYLKEPIDTLADDFSLVLQELRDYFFKCKWCEVYDFIEFIANNYPNPQRKENFVQACNKILEREMSGYRFVNGRITRITDQQEIEAIGSALKGAEDPVRTHLQRALELLSDRKKPDYRNSIKESISAVESLVASVVGKKGSLGTLLKRLDEEIALHPALRSAFDKLYGYTSDEDGIRHAILEAKTFTFEDAKFFLVVCSAFVNYVQSRLATKRS